LAVIDYNRIRTELERIIECCGATALVILVDEWSSVDIGMQPLLAEMIQKTLTLSHRIYLKLAALQFFTRTSSSIGAAQPIGLQSGVDIAPLMDLDELLNCDIDPVGVTAFLTQVALKHVGGDLPSVRAWSPETFQEFLCKEIFDRSDTYVQVVRASEGNPRDFLRMLSLCCAFVHNDERISSVVAQRAAIKNFVDVKAPAIEGREGANHLFDLLFARIVKNRSGKAFLLTRSKCETDQRIRELWHYRFIHLIERSCSVLDMNDAFIEYSLFAMDYGKLMSLKVQRSSEMLLGLVGATDELIGGITGKSIGGLTQFLGSTALGAGLMTATASMIVAREGAETTDVRQIEELVSKCVFDDLLNER
jgi:hypothetical protein